MGVAIVEKGIKCDGIIAFLKEVLGGRIIGLGGSVGKGGKGNDGMVRFGVGFEVFFCRGWEVDDAMVGGLPYATFSCDCE